MKSMSLGLDQALRLTLENIRPLPAEEAPLLESVGRVAAADLRSLVDSPPRDVSRKDGYAVACRELAGATAASPARLRVLGALVAGGVADLELQPGTTVRVLTGARLPSGADAVVAEEYAQRQGEEVLIDEPVATGFNVLPRGGDAATRQAILSAGQGITPVLAGLLAAAGHSMVPVHRRPLVGIVGTGDEIVAPGQALGEGQLYASNIVTLAGLCRQHGMTTSLAIARDRAEDIARAIDGMAKASDAVITSGGAWRGDHDLVARVLDGLGWQKIFHRIRIGPGKAVGFGLLGGKPLFILPGGPPSNLMGFLQIGLPGLQALGGLANPGLPRINAVLGADIADGKPEWTDFFYGVLEPGEGLPVFQPMQKRVRMASIARATAVAAIPEGRDRLAAGEVVPVQLLG